VGRLGLVGLVAVAVLMGACSSDDSSASVTEPSPSTTAPAPSPAPAQLVDRTCDTAASLGPTRCYFLEVPEHRDVAGSRTIKLWVAVVTPANAPSDALPLIFLPGGPGGDTSSMARDPSTTWPGSPRPVVYLDERGMGRSEPDMSCPEVVKPLDASHPWTERRDATAAQLVACRERVVAAGVDLDGYNTREVAADVVALRLALGFDEWIVWGFSYGGRVAQEVLRQDPDGVAALLLDSPLTAAPVGPAARIANDKASTATLAAACNAEPSCASVTPDLSATIDAAIAQANAHPYTAHPTAGDGTDLSVLMTGQEVQQGKVIVTADPTSVGILPGAAKSIASGATGMLDLIAAGLTDPPGGPIASSDAIECADDQAGLTEADQAAIDDPGNFGTFFVLGDWPYCGDVWRVASAPLDAPESDVPTLIFEGGFDPVLPPTLGEDIAKTLTHSTIVVIPAGSHGNATGTPCASSITGAFLDDPPATLDTSCVSTLPAPFAP